MCSILLLTIVAEDLLPGRLQQSTSHTLQHKDTEPEIIVNMTYVKRQTLVYADSLFKKATRCGGTYLVYPAFQIG